MSRTAASTFSVRALTAASTLALAAGCGGVGMRSVVEGDMRFEHCYRIDDDPSTPLPGKRACWADWTKNYTKGQDRSRIKYARERIHVLDDVASGTLAVAPVGTPIGADSAAACPPPSSPYVPPPSLAASASPKTNGEVSAVNVPSAKWQACSEGCTKTWRGCVSPCNATTPCLSECDTAFHGCMKTCL